MITCFAKVLKGNELYLFDIEVDGKFVWSVVVMKLPTLRSMCYREFEDYYNSKVGVKEILTKEWACAKVRNV